MQTRRRDIQRRLITLWGWRPTLTAQGWRWVHFATEMRRPAEVQFFTREEAFQIVYSQNLSLSEKRAVNRRLRNAV